MMNLRVGFQNIRKIEFRKIEDILQQFQSEDIFRLYFDILNYKAAHPYVINMIERYKRVRKYIDMSDEEFKDLINPDHIYYNFLTIRLLNGEETSIPTYRIKHELATGPEEGRHPLYLSS